MGMPPRWPHRLWRRHHLRLVDPHGGHTGQFTKQCYRRSASWGVIGKKKSCIIDGMLSKAVQSDPDILGGEVCFAGTRVPAEYLFSYLIKGYTLDYFLYEFPTVGENLPFVYSKIRRSSFSSSNSHENPAGRNASTWTAILPAAA